MRFRQGCLLVALIHVGTTAARHPIPFGRFRRSNDSASSLCTLSGGSNSATPATDPTESTPKPRPKKVRDSSIVPVPPGDTNSTNKRTRQSLQEQASAGTSHNKMPSLFLQPEEQYLDKYAACLAATEGLRKLRDSAIEQGKRGESRGRHTTAGSLRGLICGDRVDTNDPDYQQACAEYLMNSSKVIRALGLSVAQFNRIGREVSSDPLVKEKVLEQAYLYRITATLNMDKVPLIHDPSSEELLRATKRHRVQMFAKSMTEIEELRQEQTEKLIRALHIERLPENLNIADPNIRPLLSPKVRAVVEAFPHQAEEIVKKYGLNSDEFNQMMEETNKNPVFRWKVKKILDEGIAPPRAVQRNGE